MEAETVANTLLSLDKPGYAPPVRILFVLLALAACEHGKSPAMADGGGDGPLVGDSFDPCKGAGVFLTGELVDWDSSATAFAGVAGAKLSAPGNPTPIVTTPPNGRLDACVPDANPLRFDVDAPSDYLDGALVIERAAVRSLHPLSLRSLKAARVGAFFTDRGLVFNPDRAQVVVFLAGDRSSITLDRAHGPAQAGNDDAQPGTVVWSAGDVGRYVVFPNVDVTQATGTIKTPMSNVSVPLAAGKLTLVAVSFVFI